MHEIFFRKSIIEKKTEFDADFKRGEKILLQKLSTKREGAEILNFIQKCKSFRPLACILIFLSGFQTRLVKTILDFR